MPRLLLATLLLVFAGCSGPSSGGPCSSNRDCVNGETCVRSTCVPAGTMKMQECTTDDNCPLDQYCDQMEHVCKTAGGGGPDTGIPDPPDSGIPGPDSGLPPVDDAGTPPPQCVIDTDCMPGPPQQVCINNQCVLGCEANPGLCTQGQVCDTNTGRCVMIPPVCSMDQECGPPTRVCESTQCVPGCGQPAGIQCTGVMSSCNMATGRCEAPPPPPPCNLDVDCGDPMLICVSMLCTPRCDAPAGGCPGGQVCNPADGRCLPNGIALGGTCTIDGQCASNFCLGINVGMSNFTVCSEPCSASSNCPLNFACGNVSGMNFCLGENLFSPPATFDTPTGGFCDMTTNTCQSGWCNTGASTCIETCSRENDCTNFGGNCHTYTYMSGMSTAFDHICYAPGTGSNTGASCTANGGCRSGVCNRYTSTCARHCCADTDCGASETCLVYDLDAATPVKVCAPRSATAGTGALGASCTVASDCESELCAPVNPADMASPMKCSTSCCTSSDCNALPLGGRCRPFNGPIMNTLLGACIPN